MKKLYENFTTPEQSKRLLELGVPAWTADLYFYEEGCIGNNDEPSGVIPYDEVYEDNSKETMFSSYVELPCWSVGRLIEVLVICNNFGSCTIDWVSFCVEQSPLQAIYDELCAGVTQGLLDFKKLEQ